MFFERKTFYLTEQTYFQVDRNVLGKYIFFFYYYKYLLSQFQVDCFAYRSELESIDIFLYQFFIVTCSPEKFFVINIYNILRDL